jgi:hypothetical protein
MRNESIKTCETTTYLRNYVECKASEVRLEACSECLEIN